MQSVSLNNQINIAMRKFASGNLTAGMICNIFKESVKDFIASVVLKKHQLTRKSFCLMFW